MASEASGSPYVMPFEAQFDEGRAQLFKIRHILSRVHTTTLVKILTVTPTAGKVGFVDVLPLIEETDTAGVVIAQSPIYNVPYMRYQGGTSAVILDPAVGDVGLALFAERDITSLKKTVAAGAAPTARQHSSADALYIGGILNGDPTQYVEFLPDAAGINIKSPGNIALQAGGAITIAAGGNVTVSGALLVLNIPVEFNQAVTSTPTAANSFVFSSPIVAPDFIDGNGVHHATHEHVETGSKTNGPVNP